MRGGHPQLLQFHFCSLWILSLHCSCSQQQINIHLYREPLLMFLVWHPLKWTVLSIIISWSIITESFFLIESSAITKIIMEAYFLESKQMHTCDWFSPRPILRAQKLPVDIICLCYSSCTFEPVIYFLLCYIYHLYLCFQQQSLATSGCMIYTKMWKRKQLHEVVAVPKLFKTSSSNLLKYTQVNQQTF